MLLKVGGLERQYPCAGVIGWFTVKVFVSGVNVSRGGIFKPFFPMFLLHFIDPVA